MITIEAMFWIGATFGVLVFTVCLVIGSLIEVAVIKATTCKKCGKSKKECKCEKDPTKKELVKEIRKFQKQQELEKLKERLEILKKGDK